MAAMLIISAVNKLQETAVQPDPFAAVAWLTAVMAIAVAVVMFAEYFIHGRQAHLYLGSSFLAVGVLGIWDALTFPYKAAFQDASHSWSYLLIWQLQWLTLGLGLLYGMVQGKKFNAKDQVISRSAVAALIGVLYAAAAIFAITSFVSQDAASADWVPSAGMIVSLVCVGIFAVALVGYGRGSVHRNNAIITWMAYGLIFGMLGQLAMGLSSQPSAALFWFANVMKIIVFLMPLLGMLAEHTRLQVRLRDQAYHITNMVQSQQAVTSLVNPADLYARLAEIARQSFSARAACLLQFEKDRGLLRVSGHSGLDEDSVKRLIFRPGEGPVGDAFSDKQIVVVPDLLEDRSMGQRLDGMGEITTGVFAPLVTRDESKGVLALFFSGRHTHKLGKDQLRLLDVIATQAAMAVEENNLRDRISDSSRTSGGYAQELEMVWEIGRAVGSELDLHTLVATLSDKLKGAVAATECSVLLFEPDLVGMKILGNKKLTRYHSAAEHVDQCDAVAVTVARRNEAVIVNDVPNSCHCKFPELQCEDGGVHHLLCVPMNLRGFTGAISVFRRNGDAFGEGEKRLLMRLAPVVAAGLRNAELYEREASIARNLEESLRSRVEQELTGIAVSGAYQAAWDESLVGGDFYDVIDFGNGKYGVAIGDVSGKGVEAAVYTGMTRYMIQAYSADDIDPVYVASKLNAALCRYTPIGKFVTVVYGVVDTDAKTLTYVNAGHETPFIHRRETGKLDTLASTGPAAGAIEEGQYTSETVDFGHGDTLVLYTDGATEARHDGKFLGTDGLQKMLIELVPKHPDDLPEALIAAIKAYAKGRLRDDIAVLTVTAKKPGALF